MKLSQPQTTALRLALGGTGAQVDARTNTLSSLVRLGLAEWKYRRNSLGRTVKYAALTEQGAAVRDQLRAADAEQTNRAAQRNGATGPVTTAIFGDRTTATHSLRVYRHYANAPGKLADRTPDRLIYTGSLTELRAAVTSYGIPGKAWDTTDSGWYSYSGEIYVWGPRSAFHHPEAPSAPRSPQTDPTATVCGHPTDRPYLGKDRAYRCEPCHQATTAGVCDRCGNHAPRRIEAYHQMVCPSCLHGDHTARVSAARAATPVIIGKGDPYAVTPVNLGGAFPPAAKRAPARPLAAKGWRQEVERQALEARRKDTTDPTLTAGDIVFSGGVYAEVTEIITHAPGTHPDSPIRNDMTAVEVVTDMGTRRWHGRTAPVVHSVEQGPGNTIVCACGYSDTDTDKLADHFTRTIPFDTVEMSDYWQISGRGTLVYVDAGETEALAWRAAAAAGVDRDYYHCARRLSMADLEALTAPAC